MLNTVVLVGTSEIPTAKHLASLPIIYAVISLGSAAVGLTYVVRLVSTPERTLAEQLAVTTCSGKMCQNSCLDAGKFDVLA
jgi:hypothetical protein